MRRVARRQAGADRHRLHAAVHAEGQQHQASRARPAFSSSPHKAGSRRSSVRVYGFSRHDRFQELPCRGEVGRWAERADRPRACAGRRVQRIGQRRAEAACQGRARLLQDGADGAEAEAVQGRDRGVRQAERRQGQGSDGCRLAARRHHRAVPAGPCQRRRRVRRAGDGASDRHPGAGEARCHRVEQRFLAAVEVRRAGDVEQQAVGGVHRRQRRDAERPEGEAPEPGRVGFRLGGAQRDAWQDLLRVRQCLSWLQPGLRRCRVHRQHHLPPVFHRPDGERPREAQSLDHQQRQVQRQDAAAAGGGGRGGQGQRGLRRRCRRGRLLRFDAAAERGSAAEAAPHSDKISESGRSAAAFGQIPRARQVPRRAVRTISIGGDGSAGAFGQTPRGGAGASPSPDENRGIRSCTLSRRRRGATTTPSPSTRGEMTRVCPRRPWNVLPSSGTRSTARRTRRSDF